MAIERRRSSGRSPLRRQLALVLALLSATPLPAFADDASAQVRALEERLHAPCCRGQMMSGHESPAVHALREELRQRFGRGEGAEAIEADLVGRYGASIVAIPRDQDPRGGLSVALTALLAVSALLLLVLGMRWVRRTEVIESVASPAPKPEPADAAALDARIEQELDRIER